LGSFSGYSKGEECNSEFTLNIEVFRSKPEESWIPQENSVMIANSAVSNPGHILPAHRSQYARGNTTDELIRYLDNYFKNIDENLNYFQLK
jgi:hypothetical protein